MIFLFIFNLPQKISYVFVSMLALKTIQTKIEITDLYFIVKKYFNSVGLFLCRIFVSQSHCFLFLERQLAPLLDLNVFGFKAVLSFVLNEFSSPRWTCIIQILIGSFVWNFKPTKSTNIFYKPNLSVFLWLSLVT